MPEQCIFQFQSLRFQLILLPELVHLQFMLEVLNGCCYLLKIFANLFDVYGVLLDMTFEGKELLAKSNNMTQRLHIASALIQ